MEILTSSVKGTHRVLEESHSIFCGQILSMWEATSDLSLDRLNISPRTPSDSSTRTANQIDII
jgi:hypothetical protein